MHRYDILAVSTSPRGQKNNGGHGEHCLGCGFIIRHSPAYKSYIAGLARHFESRGVTVRARPNTLQEGLTPFIPTTGIKIERHCDEKTTYTCQISRLSK